MYRTQVMDFLEPLTADIKAVLWSWAANVKTAHNLAAQTNALCKQAEADETTRQGGQPPEGGTSEDTSET